ncbi:MAG: HzsA-related protein [Caldimonas sp.]
MNKLQNLSAIASALGALIALGGCSGGSTSESSTLTVAGDVPIAYAKRVNTIGLNPTNGAPTAPGGDLIIREKSSASAIEHNITAQFTQGNGDAQNPDVSYDGKKIVFSMRCPASNTSMIGTEAACTGHWNIWEYDMTVGGLTGGTFRRITSSTTSDDVEPTYLPAGKGFVFTSNRQTKSSVNQALGHTYFALDEYERERVFNLHTADNDGANITQISFNQSHDRNPTVRPNGDIMFSRWDHVAGRNHFKIFRAKPDGTDLFVLYGAHSPGNSFLHPRDMDPKGKFKGFVASDLMPLSRTHEGGGLVFIDAANYSEENTPANAGVPTTGGQTQPTVQALNIGGGISQYGRISSPFPLWDGTDRVLFSYMPCEVTKKGVVVLCATLTADELARLGDDNRLVADIQADDVQNNVPPSYSIYMFDPVQQTFLIVAAPPTGFMYVHPVAIQPRTEPNATDPTNVDPALAAQGLGLLEVRSVYDTDGLGRMGDSVLSAVDLPAGCTTAIVKTAPSDPLDTRAQVADLVRMKDPADTAYGCAPARFIRAIRAVAPPSGMSGLRSAIGETEFEMQQILGYAPIEPDGSFKLNVPADTPIALAVVDSTGRAFQTHTNWIQVRPGERRTCDGCHSPRRGGAINSGAVVNALPAGLLPAMAAAHQSGETMASTRTRLDATALSLGADPVYADVWADTSKAGVTAKSSLAIRYTGNAVATDDLVTAAPANGIINYPDHIQPLWTRPRGPAGANTCTNCHNDPAKLDLSATIGGSGRVSSYDEVMIGDPVIDPVTGLPKTRIEEGVLVIERGPALVDTSASEGEIRGLTRKSRLSEILWGQDIFSGADARLAHPSPPASAPDHSRMLNAAEKRVVAEWIDLGGKYYNDPFDAASGVRTITGLSKATFESDVLPILTSTCAASCHQAIGSSTSAVPVGTSFRNNRFVLTGDVDGDYGVTLTMISNACNAASNYLLKKPSTVPHPTGAVGMTTAVLPVGSANYNKIAAWIATGC